MSLLNKVTLCICSTVDIVGCVACCHDPACKGLEGVAAGTRRSIPERYRYAYNEIYYIML